MQEPRFRQNKVKSGRVHIVDRPEGCVGFEDDARFGQERLVEAMLRLVSALAILAGYFHWFLPEALHPAGTELHLHLLTTVLLIGGGVGLYLFAGRGFQRMVSVNLQKRELRLERLNSQNRSLVQRHVAFSDIDSLFVSRAKFVGQPPGLYLSVRGLSEPLLAVEGQREDLTEFHQVLSDALFRPRSAAPKRVRRIPTGIARPARPQAVVAS